MTRLTAAVQRVFIFILIFYLCRISRTERSGRYGSDQSRDDSDWRDRRERDQERDNMRRWNDERRNDRFEDRRGSRDSPEVFFPDTQRWKSC